MKLKKGLIHIYTGNGKGKTTAAIGQGVRAAGSGLRVYMIQFLKTLESGELEALKEVSNFSVFRFESDKGFFWNLNDEEKALLKYETEDAMNFVKTTMKNMDCDVLILDEIFGSIKNELLNPSDLITILKNKPKSMEVIMTGRNAPMDIIEIADYVSDIKMVKHPFQEGMSSRKGIEY